MDGEPEDGKDLDQWNVGIAVVKCGWQSCGRSKSGWDGRAEVEGMESKATVGKDTEYDIGYGGYAGLNELERWSWEFLMGDGDNKWPLGWWRD